MTNNTDALREALEGCHRAMTTKFDPKTMFGADYDRAMMNNCSKLVAMLPAVIAALSHSHPQQAIDREEVEARARELLAATYDGESLGHIRSAILNGPAEEFGQWFHHAISAIEAALSLTPALDGEPEPPKNVITPEWCINMAHLEGDCEIGAGLLALDAEAPEAFAVREAAAKLLDDAARTWRWGAGEEEGFAYRNKACAERCAYWKTECDEEKPGACTECADEMHEHFETPASKERRRELKELAAAIRAMPVDGCAGRIGVIKTLADALRQWKCGSCVDGVYLNRTKDGSESVKCKVCAGHGLHPIAFAALGDRALPLTNLPTGSTEAGLSQAGLVDALKQISRLCPVTCDMTLAHEMAAIADEALSQIQPEGERS